MRAFVKIASSAIVAHHTTGLVAAASSHKDTPRPENHPGFSFRRARAPAPALDTVHEPQAPVAARKPQRPQFGRHSQTREVSRTHDASRLVSKQSLNAGAPTGAPCAKAMGPGGRKKTKEQLKAELQALKRQMHQDTPRYGLTEHDRSEGVCEHVNADIPYGIRREFTGPVARAAGIKAAAMELATHERMAADGHKELGEEHWVDYAHFETDSRMPKDEKIVFDRETQQMRKQRFGSDYRARMMDADLKTRYERQLERLQGLAPELDNDVRAQMKQAAALNQGSFLRNKQAAWKSQQQLPSRVSFASWNKGRESASPKGSTKQRAEMLKSLSARADYSRAPATAAAAPAEVIVVSSDDESTTRKAKLCTPTNQTPSTSGDEHFVEDLGKVSGKRVGASAGKRLPLSPNTRLNEAAYGLVGLLTSGSDEDNCGSPLKKQRGLDGKENSSGGALVGRSVAY